MARIESWFNQDLQNPVKVQYLAGNVFSADNDGNIVGVNVYDNGEPANLGGSVSANVVRSDGTTVAVAGTLSENQASVILPQAAYAVPGVVSIIIKLTDSGVITTLCAVVANVYRSTTDTVVDPGTIIPSVQDLIDDIETAIASIPADYSDLLAAVASDYSSSKTYPVVGSYAWYDGVLKRSVVPITTAESYTAAHWTNAVVGDDLSDLKSALLHVADGAESISVLSYQSISCAVSATCTLTRSASKYMSRQIPRDEKWQGIRIVPKTGLTAVVTFVKTQLPTTPTSGTDATPYLATGETGRHVIAAGTVGVLELPSDTAYIVVTTVSNSTNVVPTSVEMLTGSYVDIVDLQEDDEMAKKRLDKIEDTISNDFTLFVQKNINSSTGKLTNTGAENCITNESLIPIKSLRYAKSDDKNIRIYLYFSNGAFNTAYDDAFSYIGVEEIEKICSTYTAVYCRVRFGDSTNPVTLSDYTDNGVELVLFDGFDKGNGSVTLENIAKYGEEGVFTPSGDSALEFSVTVPYVGDDRNQIFTCVAKYTQAEGVSLRPSVQFMTGTGLNGTSVFDIGGNGHFEIKQWRVIRYPGDKTAVTVNFKVPVGVTCTILDFHNEYTNEVNRTPYGIRINSHRRFPMTPQDTLPGVEMGAKAGAVAMIEIPKRLSDGTWIFYHDDTLVYNDTYIRQADGTELPSTYNGTAWSAIDFDTANSWDWGVSKSELYAGTKPMTMEQFFTFCGKTGIMPMLSVHPWDGDHISEVKDIARKCGVLSRLGIKCTVNNIADAYSVFGNEIESYTIDITSGSQSASVINAAITAMNGLTGCTVRRVIELFASTAYNAYFGSSQYDAFKLISDAGYGCALAQQTGAYHPTAPNESSVLMKPSDFDYWQNKGVTEFTYEYNWSFGLNW